ncbi:hypothetical protein BC829DRAFT_417509 [Chytridium lagenaria]|nr:hypothetical protein BC829DRAFT_417509 [Chytridium lagenaria]
MSSSSRYQGINRQYIPETEVENEKITGSQHHGSELAPEQAFADVAAPQASSGVSTAPSTTQGTKRGRKTRSKRQPATSRTTPQADTWISDEEEVVGEVSSAGLACAAEGGQGTSYNLTGETQKLSDTAAAEIIATGLEGTTEVNAALILMALQRQEKSVLPVRKSERIKAIKLAKEAAEVAKAQAVEAAKAQEAEAAKAQAAATTSAKITKKKTANVGEINNEKKKTANVGRCASAPPRQRLYDEPKLKANEEAPSIIEYSIGTASDATTQEDSASSSSGTSSSSVSSPTSESSKYSGGSGYVDPTFDEGPEDPSSPAQSNEGDSSREISTSDEELNELYEAFVDIHRAFAVMMFPRRLLNPHPSARHFMINPDRLLHVPSTAPHLLPLKVGEGGTVAVEDNWGDSIVRNLTDKVKLSKNNNPLWVT